MKQKDKLTKQSSDLTDKKEFQPTPHMIVWLDTQIRTGSDVIDEIARESKVADATWYTWLQKPGFEDWYWTEYDRRVRRWKPTVDALGLKYARKGSPQHFEYLAKRVGNIQEKPGTLQQFNIGEGTNGNTITFVNFNNESKG